MPNDKLEAEIKEALMIIDLAIEAIEKHPPEELNNGQLKLVRNAYLKFREEVLSYTRLQHVKETKKESLTYFFEGEGTTVNYFWQQVEARQLPVKRVNVLEKVLQRKRISNQYEYDVVIDTMVPAQQEGRISEDDLAKLDAMIGKVESRKSKR